MGADGEQRAADWYAANGYEVVARNWRSQQGELDLIARRGREFVFVEVKARRSERYGVPAEAVNRAKQARIRRLAASWLEREAPLRARAIRFDVVAVLRGDLEVIEGAF